MEFLKTMISKIDQIVVVFKGILEIPSPYKTSRQRAAWNEDNIIFLICQTKGKNQQ